MQLQSKSLFVWQYSNVTQEAAPCTASEESGTQLAYTFSPDPGVTPVFLQRADESLTRLAFLCHCRSSPVHIFASSNSLHSYARPPQASSSRRVRVRPEVVPSPPCGAPVTSRPYGNDCVALTAFVFLTASPQASSESESGVFCTSSLSDDDDLGWSHSWPPTAWHCFLKGTNCRRRGHLRLHHSIPFGEKVEERVSFYVGHTVECRLHCAIKMTKYK